MSLLVYGYWLLYKVQPNVPESLTATSGDGDMTLNWINATNANAGYEYRYSSDSSGLSLTDLDSEYTCPTAPPGAPAECKWLEATTSETITGLTVGTAYFFQVRSKHADHDGNGIEYSGPSNLATDFQRATPAAIDDLAAEPGNGEVTLTWTHLSDYNIVNYEVNRSSGGVWTGYQTTAKYKVSLLDGTATHTVTELVNGTTYSFLVRGTNSVGGETKTGDDSNSVSVTPSGPPAAPASLTAQETSAAGTEVRLNWADPNNPSIDRYQYRYRVSGDDSAWGPGTTGDKGWANVQGSGASTTDFTVTGLTEDTGYFFEVRAIDSGLVGVEGIGPESSVTGTPTIQQTAPAAMTDVQHTVTGVSGGAGGTVTFTWEDPGDDSIDKYQYRYDANENNPGEGNWDQDWDDIPVTPVTNNNKDMTSWGPVGIHGSGIATYYELRAINTTPDPDLPGLATPITVARANTPIATTPPPSAPTNLAISAGSDSVTVSWDIPATDTSNWKWYRQEKQNDGDYDDWALITEAACSSDSTRYC